MYKCIYIYIYMHMYSDPTCQQKQEITEDNWYNGFFTGWEIGKAWRKLTERNNNFG